MLNKIVSLTEKFVSIKSAQDNKDELEKILELALSNLKDHTIERFESNGVKSALVHNSKKRPKKFRVILNGHLDVIPGKEYQYNPKIKGDNLYGVGSMDMKASVACLITAFNEVAKKVNYPLGLQLVTDEEIGGFNGTKYQVDKGIKADFVIVGENTNFNIENQAKGILWLKIFSRGKAAHSAYPWKGKNAIWKMNEFLNLLEKQFPIPNKKTWITTVNLSKISTSNKTFNKIPDNCEIWLDIRYVPNDSKTIVGDIKKLLPKGFKLDVVAKEPALFVEEKSKYLKLLRKVGKQIAKKEVFLKQGQGSSDARHFTRVNCDAIEFGPIGKGMGTDNEWVDIPSLYKYHQILKEFLLSI